MHVCKSKDCYALGRHTRRALAEEFLRNLAFAESQLEVQHSNRNRSRVISRSVSCKLSVKDFRL